MVGRVVRIPDKLLVDSINSHIHSISFKHDLRLPGFADRSNAIDAANYCRSHSIVTSTSLPHLLHLVWVRAEQPTTQIREACNLSVEFDIWPGAVETLRFYCRSNTARRRGPLSGSQTRVSEPSVATWRSQLSLRHVASSLNVVATAVGAVVARTQYLTFRTIYSLCQLACVASPPVCSASQAHKNVMSFEPSVHLR